MAYVYWIHLPQHSSIATEGYVGVTQTSVEHRFSQHAKMARCSGQYPIHHAIRKYGDQLRLDTVFDGDIEDCCQMERELRPEPNIGWNIAVGGSETMFGRKHSAESIAKMIKTHTGMKHSEDTKRKISLGQIGTRPDYAIEALIQRNKLGHSEESRSKIRAARIGTVASDQTRQLLSDMRLGSGNSFYGKSHSDETKTLLAEKAKERLELPWNHPRADLAVWSNADTAYSVLQSGTAAQVAAALLSTKSKCAKLVAKLKSGWNPLEDAAWLAFKHSYSKESLNNERTP